MKPTTHRYLVRISYAGLTERLTVIAVSPAEAARSALTARADHRPSLLSVEVAS